MRKEKTRDTVWISPEVVSENIEEYLLSLAVSGAISLPINLPTMKVGEDGSVVSSTDENSLRGDQPVEEVDQVKVDMGL